jgi:hypothetical protein
MIFIEDQSTGSDHLISVKGFLGIYTQSPQLAVQVSAFHADSLSQTRYIAIAVFKLLEKIGTFELLAGFP